MEVNGTGRDSVFESGAIAEKGEELRDKKGGGRAVVREGQLL